MEVVGRNLSSQNLITSDETVDLGIPPMIAEVVDNTLTKENGAGDEFNRSTSIQSQQTGEVPAELLKTYYCGCGPFHPKFLQLFASKKFFTFLMFVYALIQGCIVTGFSSVNVSSIETRYSLSSTLIGVLLGCYDGAVVVSVIFISYFGGKSHKPRLLGIGTIVLGIGALLFASPQFFFGRYRGSSDSALINEECLAAVEEEAADCSGGNIGAYIIFLLSQIVIGIGSAPVYSIAIAYIDEIVFPRFVPLHIGTFFISSVFGPAVGFGIGSLFLSVYVDPWLDTDLDSSDPAWVGAWWVGYVIMGILSLFMSIPFLMYPKWLPDSYLVREERSKEMAKIYSKKYANEDSLSILVKMFPIHIKRLLTNPSFMFSCAALSTIFLVKDGVVSFGPKYVESMFGLTATTAGLLAGGLGITAALGGILTGAFIIYLWKPKGRKTVLVQVIVVFITIPSTLGYLLRCPTPSIAGITTPYADGALSGRDSSACAAMCNCTSTLFEPVCGSDGITYFSTCRAGCSMRLENDEYVFENCTCIAESLVKSTDGTITIDDVLYNNSTIEEGLCSNSCTLMFGLFVILLFVLVFLLLMLEIPYYHFTLRVVADDQRHLALGIQSAIFRVFGSIPGPLLFGVVIDTACVDWNTECGIRGNCWVYDNQRLGLNALAFCAPCAIVAFLFFVLAMVVYPKQRIIDEIDKEKLDIEKKNGLDNGGEKL